MKEKAWKNVIAVLIIALALMAGGINVSAASGITIRQGKVYQNNKVYTGWFSQNNGKYYSVKGIRAKGWKKISNKYYYFDRNSRLITNHIVGSLTCYGGVADELTRDVKPHGVLKGKKIKSPKILLGFFENWCDGLETYAKVNAIISPPKEWGKAVPFGWNSWGALQFNLTSERYGREDLCDRTAGWIQ